MSLSIYFLMSLPLLEKGWCKTSTRLYLFVGELLTAVRSYSISSVIPNMHISSMPGMGLSIKRYSSEWNKRSTELTCKFLDVLKPKFLCGALAVLELA